MRKSEEAVLKDIANWRSSSITTRERSPSFYFEIDFYNETIGRVYSYSTVIALYAMSPVGPLMLAFREEVFSRTTSTKYKALGIKIGVRRKRGSGSSGEYTSPSFEYKGVQVNPKLSEFLKDKVQTEKLEVLPEAVKGTASNGNAPQSQEIINPFGNFPIFPIRFGEVAFR